MSPLVMPAMPALAAPAPLSGLGWMGVGGPLAARGQLHCHSGGGQTDVLALSAAGLCLCGLAYFGCLMEPPVQLWQRLGRVPDA